MDSRCLKGLCVFSAFLLVRLIDSTNEILSNFK